MKDYKYDISISFANEDINIALCLYLAFKLNGLNKSTFYYRENMDYTGQDLEKSLPKIYGKESKYVISIISKDYAKSKYSQIELESIIKRWKKNPEHTFWIPVITDKTLLSELDKELRDSIAYVIWDLNPENIAHKIYEMLGGSVKQAKEIASKITYRAKNFNQFNGPTSIEKFEMK
jgi:hypothetical protein